MTKVINAYNGFTADTIKSRSNIPAQADMVVAGTGVNCNKIKTSDIKSALSESTNKLNDLNTSSNINEYSNFSPGWWQYGSSIVSFITDTAGYKKDEWAGYNHVAPLPSKSNYSTSANIIYNGYSDVVVTANISVGEVDWTNVFLANVDGLAMRVKQGSTIKSTQSLLYTDARQQSGFNFSDTVSMSGAGTLTVEFFLWEDGSILAPMPGISSHNITVTVLYPADFGTVELDSVLQAAHPTWTLIYDEGLSEIDQVNDTYTFTNLAIDNDGDDEGDVSRFNLELYVQRSTDKETLWWLVNEITFMPTTGITITDDDLPWVEGVDYGDILNFELRDA